MRPRSKFYIFESLLIAPIVLRISHRNALVNGELPALFICATPLCFSAAEAGLQRISTAHATHSPISCLT
jgi:hypothetical protein